MEITYNLINRGMYVSGVTILNYLVETFLLRLLLILVACFLFQQSQTSPL